MLFLRKKVEVERGAMTVNLPARSAAEVYRWIDVNVYRKSTGIGPAVM
jgi:hypothetical protein